MEPFHLRREMEVWGWVGGWAGLVGCLVLPVRWHVRRRWLLCSASGVPELADTCAPQVGRF